MTPAARERARVRIPLGLVSACAWAALIGPGGNLLHAEHHAHHAHARLDPTPLADLPWGTLALGWALMLVAMMLPVLAAPVRHVRDRSFASRRGRATAELLVGYCAVWMLAGVASIAAAHAAQTSPEPLLATGLVAALVIVWQVSPLKQVCLNRLHGHPPLAAFGIAADLHAARLGAAHGLWCVGSCWGLMLLPMLFASGHLPMMALVSAWIWAEQLERPAPPRWALRIPLKAARIVVART